MTSRRNSKWYKWVSGILVVIMTKIQTVVRLSINSKNNRKCKNLQKYEQARYTKELKLILDIRTMWSSQLRELEQF